MSTHPKDFSLSPDGVPGAIDWLGNRFEVGDLVMYCVGAGRGQMMAVGRVTEVLVAERMARRSVPDPSKAGAWIVEHYTVEEVRVQVLTERTSGSWDNGKRSRPAWVNPMNITALPGMAIPCE